MSHYQQNERNTEDEPLNDLSLSYPTTEQDLLIVTVFAAALDGRDTPAFAFVLERENGGVRIRVACYAAAAKETDSHNHALVEAIVEAILHCPENHRMVVESTSKGFLIPSLIEHRPKWNARQKWPKATGPEWRRFEAAMIARSITLDDARHIESSPALTHAQKLVEEARLKLQGQRDLLGKNSEY